jgi:cystathionine beta-lyase/cystathionine gamma-synthase
MLAFECKGGVAATRRVIERLEIPVKGPSLGGVETLVTRPATTSHVGLTAEERAAIGITDALVRVSVGVEAVEDLEADFTQALAG